MEPDRRKLGVGGLGDLGWPGHGQRRQPAHHHAHELGHHAPVGDHGLGLANGGAYHTTMMGKLSGRGRWSTYLTSTDGSCGILADHDDVHQR